MANLMRGDTEGAKQSVANALQQTTQDPYSGLNVLGTTKIVGNTAQELAHEIAQKNAAEMLGLHPENTAMDRAKALGFNVDEPMYHGSKNANQSYFTPSSHGELGAGTYITNNPDLASEFARHSYGGIYPEQSGVYKVLTKKLENVPREDWLNIRSAEMNRLREANKGEWSGEFLDKSMKNMRGNTEKYNAAGWYTPGMGGANQGVVFDPRNIRSVNAAFDPKLTGASAIAAGTASADLLADEDKQRLIDLLKNK